MNISHIKFKKHLKKRKKYFIIETDKVSNLNFCKGEDCYDGQNKLRGRKNRIYRGPIQCGVGNIEEKFWPTERDALKIPQNRSIGRQETESQRNARPGWGHHRRTLPVFLPFVFLVCDPPSAFYTEKNVKTRIKFPSFRAEKCFIFADFVLK